MDILNQLKQYRPWNAQEAADRELLLQWLEQENDLFSRGNPAMHFTASAWVVSPDRTQVLMAHHDLYRSWAWLGGHADGNWDLMAVAAKEAREESGIAYLSTLYDGIFSLEVLTVDGHEKRGRYVPSHLHLNLTYLFEGDPGEAVRVKADENSRVGWIREEEIPEKSTESWFVERIYTKLTRKVHEL